MESNQPIANSPKQSINVMNFVFIGLAIGVSGLLMFLAFIVLPGSKNPPTASPSQEQYTNYFNTQQPQPTQTQDATTAGDTYKNPFDSNTLNNTNNNTDYQNPFANLK